MSTTQTLDEWFAQADDVLTDWHGGVDSMRVRPSAQSADLEVADSYYEQVGITPEQAEMLARAAARVAEAMKPVAVAFARFAKRFAELQLPPVPATAFPHLPQPRLDVRTAALLARQTRNTGPAAQRGLDGHRRASR